jgi:hypothetical protein
MSPTHDAASLVTPMTPKKACELCGKPIIRRRLQARDWERIQHCSAACRRLSRDRMRISYAHPFHSASAA